MNPSDEAPGTPGPPGDTEPPVEGALRISMSSGGDPEEQPHVPPPSPYGPARPRTVRGPYSGIILAIAMLGLVIAVAWAVLSNRQVPVLVAETDLPAYHEVTPGELTMETRTAFGADGYVELPVDGRLTLRPIRRGEPLRDVDLAPSMKGLLRGPLTVVGLDVSRGAVMGGALRSGDLVQVLLLRKGRSTREVRGAVLSVSSAGPAGTGWSLVLAMNGRDARAHAAVLKRDDVLILKDPRAATPG